MAIASATQKLLVKTAAGLPARFSFGATSFRVEPLFTSIGRPMAPAAAGGGTWHVLTTADGTATTADGTAGQNPWDLCHQILQGGLGFRGAPAVEFAEPDWQQRWVVGRDAELGISLQSCNAEPQDAAFPRLADPFWFRGLTHSQFDAALALAGGADAKPRVRIAHLDTGYDPDHASLPLRLRKDLAHNFVDEDRPNDASDTSAGLSNNLGHGTGTLSILAGRKMPRGKLLGGAPFAEVVPIRVADRVILFFNSAIARALDYVHGLNTQPTTFVDIVSMSMGGVASQAWAEAVNALYEQGVFIVTAAGNNFGNLPTRNVVFPARFDRVVAACGVMADHEPYADLGLTRMAGNYGPASKMRTAMAAATPNVPWAKFGCGKVVRFNGSGTSAATPQVAAAAALWIQRNRDALEAYPQPWMRVEAIRKALFDHAALNSRDPKLAERLGRGELRARDAMTDVPAAADLNKEQPDSGSFASLPVLTGMGAAPPAQMRMLELEALQLSQDSEIEALLPDPDVPAGELSSQSRRQIADALGQRASETLQQRLGDDVSQPVTLVEIARPATAIERLHLKQAIDPLQQKPSRRSLRVYAYDPSLSSRIETLRINEAMLDIRWEGELAPGPVGEYIEVVDVDPASGCCYAPVDLNHPYLLLQGGLAPDETNPQFHQQMAYAVAMKTIEHFEIALGRVALWAPRRIDTVVDGKVHPREEYVQRLRIYPHALRTANAFYCPERKALLLGYFYTPESVSGTAVPGGVVYSALSHDIVAHETTHALLDGLHRCSREPTNQDVFAFHEAFADIVALFQHFTVPEALKHQIAKTGGDLGKQNLLGMLAVQFGEATGRYGALRDFIGRIVMEGNEPKWDARRPTRLDYPNATEPHVRGAVLVAAIFDAFLQLYKQRTEGLLRLASQGTGVLLPGDISVDLRDRLAEEASKVAGQVLRICIRALDYCPPVDINYGNYLRALITADQEFVPNDARDYRTAFVSAFRDRGIYPADVSHMSPASLVWEPPPLPLTNISNVLTGMKLRWDLNAERQTAYATSRDNAKDMCRWLADPEQVSDEELEALGLTRKIGQKTIGGISGELGPIEVHSVRPARRIGPDGQVRADLVVEITQSFRPAVGGRFRGGCTLIVDLEKAEARYFVRKRATNPDRLKTQTVFKMSLADALHENYFGRVEIAEEPFAMLHRSRE
jgi:subtilisin family serine protease